MVKRKMYNIDRGFRVNYRCMGCGRKFSMTSKESKGAFRAKCFVCGSQRLEEVPDSEMRTDEDGEPKVSRFTKLMEGNPPRLMVRHRKDESGQDQFEWGITGGMPVLDLIGFLAKFQRVEGTIQDEVRALVIIWIPEMNDFEWFIHRNMPENGTLGVVESIKSLLIDSRNAQAVTSKRVEILGPTGQPLPR